VQRGIRGCDRVGKAILVYMYIYTHIPKGNHIVAVQRKNAGCDRAGEAILICMHVYVHTYHKETHCCSAMRSCRPWQGGCGDMHLYKYMYTDIPKGNHIVAVQRGVAGCDRAGEAILVNCCYYEID